MSFVVQCELCGATYGDRDTGATVWSGDLLRGMKVDCCATCAGLLGLPPDGHIDRAKTRKALVTILAAFFHARKLEGEMEAMVKRNRILTPEQTPVQDVKMEEALWGSVGGKMNTGREKEKRDE